MEYRAFTGNATPGFSASSPSATTGGGQSNSPVSAIACFHIYSDVDDHFLFCCLGIEFGLSNLFTMRSRLPP